LEQVEQSSRRREIMDSGLFCARLADRHCAWSNSKSCERC
jgi:hypothetical protein